MRAVLHDFRGEYRFLSNFWYVDVYGYPTNEHFFQAMKSTDRVYRDAVKASRTPAKAKRLGRGVVLRLDWESIKLDVMATGLRRKFAPGTTLAEELVATGDMELREGNLWHDNYWGICGCAYCHDGRNELGQLLMKVREELQQ